VASRKHVTSIFQKLHLPVAADTHCRVPAVVAFLQSWPAPRESTGVVSHTEAASEPHFAWTGAVRA
jgi:hypothetical protein